MNILVTICARGGSKGVKNKNIRKLMGKPLIAYTIEQALTWGRASEVVVSTDSDEIADVAKKYGALVPFIRPKELATDTADKLAVIRHALLESEKIYNANFDIVIDLDVTSPIRSVEDIENCYNLFQDKRPKVLFSVVHAHKNPYFNMVEVDSNGYAHLSKLLTGNIHRRQDAPIVYSMNASIYIYDSAFLRDEKNTSIFTNSSTIYEMGDLSGVDIDREVDFKFVEFLVKEGLVSL